jgi:hypothetical protein
MIRLKNLLNEVSDEAYTLHRFTACGQNAAQDFIDDNKIDAEKLIKYLKPTDNEGMRNRYMVRDVIGGKTDNNTKQKFIKLFKESLNEASASDIIKDLDKVRNDLIKKVDILIAKKKKLYSNVDIESPMSADEKKLNKDIADIFSDIQQLIQQKRSIKEESLNEACCCLLYTSDAADDIL